MAISSFPSWISIPQCVCMCPRPKCQPNLYLLMHQKKTRREWLLLIPAHICSLWLLIPSQPMIITYDTRREETSEWSCYNTTMKGHKIWKHQPSGKSLSYTLQGILDNARRKKTLTSTHLCTFCYLSYFFPQQIWYQCICGLHCT